MLLTTRPEEMLSRARVLQAIEDFTSRLRADDRVVFYFAGHGTSLGGAYDRDPHDYLLPQDFPGRDMLRRGYGETQDDAARRLLGGNAIDVREQVLARLDAAGSAVVFIDACRDRRVLLAMRGGSDSETILGRMRGLSITRSEPKVHVLFSTSEGTGTLDGGEGQHSPFTGTLLRYLHRRENLAIASLAEEIRDDVRGMTDGRQKPRYLAANDLPVYLVSGEVGVPAPPDVTGGGGGSCPAGMVFIPGGEFMMGSPEGVGQADERPQHRVRVASFCLDRTEVSVAAYRRCVESGACSSEELTRASWGVSSVCNWGRSGADDHPVNGVDWQQSRAFCAWGVHEGGARRLPREAEWEYAAGGRHGTTYPWGNQALDGSRANAGNMPDGFDETAPVVFFAAGASPEGVLNLSGNVWEWVEDVYASDAYLHHSPEGFYARDVSGTSPSTELRALRGGGWHNDASNARAANRNRNGSTLRYSSVGFRCAAGAP